MDELSRMLLHGTAGLQAAEDAMDGDLAGALRNQAISEWAAQPQPQRPASYRGQGSSFRFRAGLVAVCAVLLLILIMIN